MDRYTIKQLREIVNQGIRERLLGVIEVLEKIPKEDFNAVRIKKDILEYVEKVKGSLL